MRVIMPAKSSISRLTLFCAATLLCVAGPFSAAVQQPSAAQAHPAVIRHTRRVRKPVSQAHPQPTPAAVTTPAPPPAPKMPDWPANDRPSPASVTWNSQGLRIDASNSSLNQILNEVSTVTGAKIHGLAGDQRIFGAFGPGAARDVISQLLDGSGYNVLMIGDQGHGTPREIVLSAQPNGPAPPPNPSQAFANDDSGDSQDDQPQPPAPSVRNGFNQPGAPRTPQQIIQEMQQRQRQIEQMQQPQNPPQ